MEYAEQLSLMFEPPDDLPDIEDTPEPRCTYCGVLLDEATTEVGFCTSECERESHGNE